MKLKHIFIITIMFIAFTTVKNYYIKRLPSVKEIKLSNRNDEKCGRIKTFLNDVVEIDTGIIKYKKCIFYICYYELDNSDSNFFTIMKHFNIGEKVIILENTVDKTEVYKEDELKYITRKCNINSIFWYYL